MLAQKVALLSEVRAKRARAQHARDLCRTITDEQAIEALTALAEELDQRAADLEASIGRTAQPARELAKAEETMAQIEDTPPKTAAR